MNKFLSASVILAVISSTSFAYSDIGAREKGPGHDANAGAERINPNAGVGLRSAHPGPKDRGAGRDANAGVERVDPREGVIKKVGKSIESIKQSSTVIRVN